VREHHGVGGAVADRRETDQRLGEDVVEPVAGDVDRPAGQQRAQRELLAVGFLRVEMVRLARGSAWMTILPTRALIRSYARGPMMLCSVR